jgi:hypothetical protein
MYCSFFLYARLPNEPGILFLHPIHHRHNDKPRDKKQLYHLHLFLLLCIKESIAPVSIIGEKLQFKNRLVKFLRLKRIIYFSFQQFFINIFYEGYPTPTDSVSRGILYRIFWVGIFWLMDKTFANTL